MRVGVADRENQDERSLLLDEAPQGDSESLSRYLWKFKVIAVSKMAVGMAGFITLLLYSMFAKKNSRAEGYIVYFGAISCVLFTIAGILAGSISKRPSANKIMSSIILACMNLLCEIALLVILMNFMIVYSGKEHFDERYKKGLLYLTIAWSIYEIIRITLSGLQICYSVEGGVFNRI